ncbi:MAG: hypothetical protein UD936_09925, partial [Acutalibacteraceae bacterium]|nr:hypothetical protein [Acutalibacteraceae bacterium]
MIKQENMLAKRIFAILLVAAMLLFTFTACSNNNTTTQEPESPEGVAVTGVEDLTNARIAVQLGTTGDLYASDYSETVDKFNKGADAVQALKTG